MTRTPLSRSKGHQAILLSAALTRKVAAAVSVGTYSAWESTATLRLLGGSRGAWAPTEGGEGRGHIVSPRAQLVAVTVVIVIKCSKCCTALRLVNNGAVCSGDGLWTEQATFAFHKIHYSMVPSLLESS